MEVIAVDLGRDRVKAITVGGKRILITSRVGEWYERKLTSGGNYEVELGDGQDDRFFVHDLAGESFCDRTMTTRSKIHLESLILFLTAVMQVSTSKDICCNVVTGVPVEQHDKETKLKFSQLLLGKHSLKVNHEAYEVNVGEVLIVPEGGGAYWDAVLGDDGELRDAWLSNQKVRVIDIGSRTINYLTITRRKYSDKGSGTLDYGVLQLHNMNEKPTDQHAEQFARKIVADLSRRWQDYDETSDAVLLTGGGSVLLESWLRPHYLLARMAANPVEANSRGFLKMGVVRWLK